MTDTDTTPDVALSAIEQLLAYYGVPAIVTTLVREYGQAMYREGLGGDDRAELSRAYRENMRRNHDCEEA